MTTGKHGGVEMTQEDTKNGISTTLYRAECISGYTDEVSPLFNIKDDAYDWLDKIPCRIDPRIKSCERCQAEWEVFDYKDEKEAYEELEQVRIEMEQMK